ncbi:hypothetical protein BT96DRAFT_462001 [Gymnopus androsaceus JB14]|uniref:Uncharacterized protein n=1 Tax=Gymnopus androsaceus JB14 TaxID=1447944 RepID=A0A6A4INK7_9AGAR|nr:hypothetical protein BT96DRAFT_462001 [Gymnopus androsaceus JB14]
MTTDGLQNTIFVGYFVRGKLLLLAGHIRPRLRRSPRIVSALPKHSVRRSHLEAGWLVHWVDKSRSTICVLSSGRVRVTRDCLGVRVGRQPRCRIVRLVIISAIPKGVVAVVNFWSCWSIQPLVRVARWKEAIPEDLGRIRIGVVVISSPSSATRSLSRLGERIIPAAISTIFTLTTREVVVEIRRIMPSSVSTVVTLTMRVVVAVAIVVSPPFSAFTLLGRRAIRRCRKRSSPLVVVVVVGGSNALVISKVRLLPITIATSTVPASSSVRRGRKGPIPAVVFRRITIRLITSVARSSFSTVRRSRKITIPAIVFGLTNVCLITSIAASSASVLAPAPYAEAGRDPFQPSSSG